MGLERKRLLLQVPYVFIEFQLGKSRGTPVAPATARMWGPVTVEQLTFDGPVKLATDSEPCEGRYSGMLTFAT